MSENKAMRFNVLSKFKRGELETGYQIIQKENIQLKKALQKQFSETNRLRCQFIEVLSLLNCKKLLRSSVPVNEKEKSLQLYIQLLNEKVSVLTHQLLNHSRFHTEVHKCFRGRTQSIYSNPICPDMKKSINKHVTELLSSDMGDATLNFNHEKEILLQNYQEEEFGHVKVKVDENKSDNNSEVIKVADNIDIIRLKILIKRLTVQNATLSYHADSANKETVALRKELDELQSELEELSKQVSKEKAKYSSVPTLVVELTSLKQKNKILLEEIREMQEEKQALKDTNQKLLEELNEINGTVNLNISLNKPS